ncbi:hypothetical protein, partial [uncultured Parabacteroides sp.]|uniref:hypothetical protein n=1 Tax=uncultured Parabacteroides sp. TaxID=512312 RepID=UPI0025F6C9E0
AVNAMKARHISKILFEIMSCFFIYRTNITKLAHIRMDFAGIMQTVGNKGRYAGLLYIHPLRGFDLFSRS